ncbi:MAG: RES family NAD+ phosphorylase [Granulosicoccus sp.]|nr:RES family NAD+ phosphorylase [Granulosicoccus sp.]
MPNAAGRLKNAVEIPVSELGWRTHHRLVASQLPTVSLFDEYVDADLLQAAFEIEGRTNPRLRVQAGNLALVNPDDLLLGPGTTPVMAAFTHIGRSSRFTDGSFGIYYAANSIETAVAEVKFHRERFMSCTSEPATNLTLRSYRGTIRKPLVDIRDAKYHRYWQPGLDTYTRCQKLGFELKNENRWGLVYPSVRNSGGQCIALLRPPATSIPRQGLHYSFHWNGQSIDQIYEIRQWKPAR